MNRILAIIERDMRRFRRSPLLVFASLVLPLTQLVVLGYAFGGKIKHLKVGVVDQDHGLPAIRLREMFGAIAANAKTFDTVEYADPRRAMLDMREGRLQAVINIPRSEEHTSELQSPCNLVCRLLLEKKKKNKSTRSTHS